MQVDGGHCLYQAEQPVRGIKLVNLIAELEPVEYLPRGFRKAVDIVDQVWGDVFRIG
jgi:hypothetical protein